MEKEYENIKEIINFLIDEQLLKANEKFPPFSSRHEAWAVILEEWQEMIEELVDCKNGIDEYWQSVKKNKNTDILKYVYGSVICAIYELSQVGAMVKKAMVLEGVENERIADK